MKYQGYYINGRFGSVHQMVINGEAIIYDSVSGEGDGEKINKLERTLGDAIHYKKEPLFGDFNADQMAEYVGG